MAEIKMDITDHVNAIQRALRETPEYKSIKSVGDLLKQHSEAIEMARDFAVDRESMGWDEHDLKIFDALVAIADHFKGKE